MLFYHDFKGHRTRAAPVLFYRKSLDDRYNDHIYMLSYFVFCSIHYMYADKCMTVLKMTLEASRNVIFIYIYIFHAELDGRHCKTVCPRPDSSNKYLGEIILF